MYKLQPPYVHPPPLHNSPTPTCLNLDVAKTWNVMSTAKKRTCVKLGGRVTPTYRWPSLSNEQNKKWPPKLHFFPYFCYTLFHDFWFLHNLELLNWCLMFFDQNDLCLTFKFKMVTANTKIKTVFIHVNYNINTFLFNGKLKKIDYVIRRLCCNAFETVYEHSIL